MCRSGTPTRGALRGGRGSPSRRPRHESTPLQLPDGSQADPWPSQGLQGWGAGGRNAYRRPAVTLALLIPPLLRTCEVEGAAQHSGPFRWTRPRSQPAGYFLTSQVHADVGK